MSEPLGVPVIGRRVALERVRQRHVAPLHWMAQSPLWTLEGRDLDPDAFASFLWSSTEITFAMVKVETDEVIGFVAGSGWDRRSGTIEVTFGVTPSEWNTFWPIEGVFLFCDYLFTGVGLRKLYFVLQESSMARLGSGVSRWLTKECTYTDHVRSDDGGFEDVHVFSLSDWDPSNVDRITGRVRS